MYKNNKPATKEQSLKKCVGRNYNFQIFVQEIFTSRGNLILFILGKYTGPGFGKDKLSRPRSDEVDGGSQSQASQGSEILRLKRRFMKDVEQTKLFFMKRNMRIQKMREVPAKLSLSRLI